MEVWRPRAFFRHSRPHALARPSYPPIPRDRSLAPCLLTAEPTMGPGKPLSGQHGRVPAGTGCRQDRGPGQVRTGEEQDRLGRSQLMGGRQQAWPFSRIHRRCLSGGNALEWRLQERGNHANDHPVASRKYSFPFVNFWSGTKWRTAVFGVASNPGNWHEPRARCAIWRVLAVSAYEDSPALREVGSEGAPFQRRLSSTLLCCVWRHDVAASSGRDCRPRCRSLPWISGRSQNVRKVPNGGSIAVELIGGSAGG